ncbi:MAG TPA: hypothetical protein VL527_08860 [Dongiaceae bacterium]|nr:hypothetical protein [Dongiaceae bacterium]
MKNSKTAKSLLKQNAGRTTKEPRNQGGKNPHAKDAGGREGKISGAPPIIRRVERRDILTEAPKVRHLTGTVVLRLIVRLPKVAAPPLWNPAA